MLDSLNEQVSFFKSCCMLNIIFLFKLIYLLGLTINDWICKHSFAALFSDKCQLKILFRSIINSVTLNLSDGHRIYVMTKK